MDVFKITKRIKPNFRTLGKAYGKKVQPIAKAVQTFTAADIDILESQGHYILDLEGETIQLTPEHVMIESDDIPGWSIAKEGSLTVALDITLTDELRQEGIAREIVNRVQNIRKDIGLDVQDKIRISIQKPTEALVNAALSTHSDYICTETQALDLSVVAELSDAKELDLDEWKVNCRIEKV